MRRVLVCVVALALGPSAAAAHAATAAPGFDTPAVASLVFPGFEPDVMVDHSPTKGAGQVYTSSPFGFSTTISFILRSNDGGQSFHLVEGNAFGKPQTCVGGGDSELQISRRNGQVFFSDLQGLTNFSNSTTTDAGRTWQTTCTAVNGTGVDRQWIGLDDNGGASTIGGGPDDGRLYEDYDNVNQNSDQDFLLGNQLVMNESLDGVHYGGQCQAPGAPCPAPAAVITRDEGIPGNVVVDDNPGSPFQHTVYAVHTGSANRSVVVSSCRGKQGDKTAAAVAADCTDPSTFTSDLGHVNIYWHDSLARTIGDWTTGNLFAALAVDTAGNVYVTWAEYPRDGDGNPAGPGVVKLAVSTDGTKSWHGPFTVSPANLGNNVMPWVTAGSPGRVGIAWYGAPQASEAGNFGPDQLDHGTWNVYYAQALDALNPAGVDFAVTKVTDHQTKFGNISTQGLGGSPDRSLGDFMQVQTGLDGEAVISYVDDTSRDRNPDYCAGCGESPPEAAGPIMVARQDSGPSLFAPVGSLTPGQHAFGEADDPAGEGYPDAFYAANGTDTAATKNLDIGKVTVSSADATHLAISMTTDDPNLKDDLATDSSLGGPVGQWLVRWAAPQSNGVGDGNIFYVGMQAGGDGSPQFYTGSTCAIGTTHTKFFTYPTTTAVPGSISGGTIRWTVPLDAVGSPATGDGLYAITGFTATQPAPSNSNAANGCSDPVTGSGAENLPNIIDASPPFTYTVGAKPSQVTPGETSLAQGAAGRTCATTAGFVRASVQRAGRRGLRFTFARRVARPVGVDVFQVSRGRTVVGNRLVARFTRRARSFTWSGSANRRGRRVTDGYYFVRFRMPLRAGLTDERRTVLVRAGGRFRVRPDFYQRVSCGLVSSFKLESPVFGGPRNHAVDIAYRLRDNANASIAVLRGSRVVKRFPARDRRRNVTYRVRLASEGLRRGTYRVRLRVTEVGGAVTETLATRRL